MKQKKKSKLGYRTSANIYYSPIKRNVRHSGKSIYINDFGTIPEENEEEVRNEEDEAESVYDTYQML